MSNTHSAQVVLLLLGAVLLVAGCGSQPSAADGPTDDGAVTVTNAGRTLSFPRAPQRVVTLNQNGTELFLALGLEDRMVGTAFKDHAILPRYRDAYEKIPVLAENYPSLEVLLEANPDFVYGFESAFNPPQGPAEMDRLERLGITAYMDRMFYSDGLTLTDVYDEIRTLGRIFRVRSRADQLVTRMKNDIQSIRERIPNEGDSIPVAIYDSGRDTFYTAGESLLSDMLRRVGAQNVFAGRLGDAWGSMSWEALVEAQPEYIVVMDYGSVSAEEKINFLIQKDGLGDVPAIRHRRFVEVPLATTLVGVRNVEAIRRLADGLYPSVTPSAR